MKSKLLGILSLTILATVLSACTVMDYDTKNSNPVQSPAIEDSTAPEGSQPALETDTSVDSEVSINQTLDELDADMDSLDIEADFPDVSEAELTQ